MMPEPNAIPDDSRVALLHQVLSRIRFSPRTTLGVEILSAARRPTKQAEARPPALSTGLALFLAMVLVGVLVFTLWWAVTSATR
jgi:hypothetical protein